MKKRIKHLKLWFKLTEMPPLSHWPNRHEGPEHFSFENSQVVQFIVKAGSIENHRYAVSLFGQAKKNGVILFDPETRLWRGNADWEP